MKKIFDYIICNYSVFLYSIVLLFFPFLFAFTADGWDTSIRISLNLLYTCIVSIVLMLCQGNVRKILSILFLLVAFAPNMIVQSFILMGNNVILKSTDFWVVFNTNPSEATNLFATLPIKVFIWAIMYVFCIAFTLYLLFKQANKQKTIIPGYGQVMAIIVLMGLSLINPFRSKIPMIDFYKSFYKYQREMREVAEFYKNRTNISLDVENSLPTGKKTFLIIIGESQNRQHMQLYGYTRPTNPKLMEIRDELIAYNNVCSPAIQTLACMKQILTFSNYEHPDLYKKEANIVEILRSGGYKTFWYDNQGKSENGAFAIDTYTPTSYRTMAKQSDVYSDEMSCAKDSSIIPILEEALKDSTEQKIIFLHLIGNHFDYRERYEKSLAQFDTNEGICSQFADELTPKEIETINAYDNGTLYNDYIIRTCIEMVRKQDGMSAMLYFSDHGEEVYDCLKNAGRSFGEGITPTMCEPPLLLWINEEYKTVSNLYLNESIPTCTDDIIYGIMDLCGVKYHLYDSTKSLFHPSYLPKERFVQDFKYEDLIEKYPKSLCE